MTGRLELHRHGSPEAFLAEAQAFLVAREAEHNLILGIAGTLHDHPAIYAKPPYLAIVRDRDAVRLVALRTPPWNLVLSECAAPDALGLVVEDLIADGSLPGVIGPAETAGAFAQRWSGEKGCRAMLDVAERIFRLSRVIAPPAPDGMWRCASSGDRRLIADWLLAFSREALPNEPQPDDLDTVVGRWLERIDRTMYLWEANGRIVSMVGVGSPTPTGIRVGPVYTPPAERGHGYASALTAAASQDQLDAGRRFCFLFTDLANPTSNHIYQQIGYEPVSDVNMIRFVDA